MLYIDTLPIPKDLLVLLACLFFGALHSRSEQQTPGFEGVRSVAVSVALGWLIGWIMLVHTALHISVITTLSAMISFLGTAVQLAMVKLGGAVLARPIPLLREVLPPFLAKFLPPDDLPPTPPPTQP